MDYQQPNYQPIGQTVETGSSHVLWYVSLIVAIAAVGLGYFYWSSKGMVEDQSSTLNQATLPQLTEGDTTADITDDLSQIPDLSASLDADAAASAGDIQAL